MTNAQKEMVADEVRDAVLSTLNDEEFTEIGLPTWADLCLIFNPKKNSITISLTEEDKFDVTLSWKDFEQKLLDVDDENGLKKLIANLKHLLKQAETELKKCA